MLQSSEYVKAHGQLDLIVEPGEGQDSQEALEDRLQSIVSMLFSGDASAAVPVSKETSVPATKEDMEVCFYCTAVLGGEYEAAVTGYGELMLVRWTLFPRATSAWGLRCTLTFDSSSVISQL